MSHIPETPTMFEVNGKGYTLSSSSARHVTEAILAGLPTIRVTGISPAAVISKTDNHWNVEGNEVRDELGGARAGAGAAAASLRS